MAFMGWVKDNLDLVFPFNPLCLLARIGYHAYSSEVSITYKHDLQLTTHERHNMPPLPKGF